MGDLSELFEPGTFLNAMRQQTARELRCSMDALKLVSSWSAKKMRKAALSVSVEGLLVQGASFDGKLLAEADSNASELTKLGDGVCVSLAYVPKSEPEPYGKGEAIGVPLYFSTAREQVLVEVAMPIQGNEQCWILAGIGVFLTD